MSQDDLEGVTQFIEMTGGQLLRIARQLGLSADDLSKVGVHEESVTRVNRQGDIELRRADHWDLIGGLLGEFEKCVREETRLDWA